MTVCCHNVVIGGLIVDINIWAGRFVPLLLALLLSACTVGPHYQRPQLPLPDSFGHESSNVFSQENSGISKWWKLFNDPILDELVEVSFQNNHDLRLGALRILEARALLGSTRSGLYPEFSADGSVTFSDASEHATANPVQTENYQLGSSFRWELDFWGRVRRSIESSEALLNVTEADFRDLRVIVAAEVANAYIQLRSAEQRIVLTTENVIIQKKALLDTRALFEEGENTLLDVSQAEAIYADTQALIPGLIRERVNARNTLATLLAIPFFEVDKRVSERSGLPWLDTAINVGVPLDIIRQRPDIQAAEWRAVSAAAEVGIAEADRLPNINLAGSLLFQVIDGVPTKAGGASGSSASDLLDSDSFAYSITPSLNLPIFDAKRRKNNVLAADARYQSSLEQLEQTVIFALRDIDNAMTQLETSHSEVNYLTTSVEAYTRAYETAAIQYEEGDIAFVSILDSLRQRVSQELSLIQARSSVSLGAISLFKALGGGWQDLEAPMLREDMVDEMRERTDWDTLLGEEP